jgi:CPA1 family monovalent cation:H+ antiporter
MKAFALGLPAEFEHRVIIIDLTLGTVLLSLMIQGTTVSALLKKLKIV